MRLFKNREKSLKTYLFFIVYINIFFPIDCFPLEIGDQITFKSAKFIDGQYHRHQNWIIYSVEAYDNVLNAYYLRKEIYDQSFKIRKRLEYKWVLSKDFPTGKQIDELLKNCELLGGKKVIKKLVESYGSYSDDGLVGYDVCITSKPLFPSNPFGPSTQFYYGHFEIFGLVKVEKEDIKTIFFNWLMRYPYSPDPRRNPQ